MSTSLPYRIAVRAARTLLPWLPGASDKLARGHTRRLGAGDRLVAWARANRDPARPLVWLHAPSVGEGLQVVPVLDRLVRRHPEWQFAYTYFSPSAEALAESVTADIADYLPYDVPDAVDRVLAALRPAALVFGKLDLWPELATRAAARGTRVGLIAATVRPRSGRLRWPVRGLLAAGYEAVSAAGAIAEADAERLAALGVPRTAITVTGDTRYDSVLERLAGVDRRGGLLATVGGTKPLVAGSTWPADEAVLLAAWRRVRELVPSAGLVVAPHEPTPAHLDSITRLAARLGLPAPVRLSEAERSGGATPFLLVDRVGVLAALYGAGALAYVGGGFGRAGLHSVLEPAAWGVPVLMGPQWAGSRDAERLLEAAGGAALPRAGAETALVARWQHWLEDDDARARAGAAARALVESGLGAAERSAALVTSLVVAQGEAGAGTPTTTPS